MSTKTQHQFKVGDLVDTHEGWRGKVVGLTDLNYGRPCTALVEDEEGKVWRIDADYGELEPVICDYCGSRKGCTCQEGIDAAEYYWIDQRQMAAAERDWWTEDKDRRAEEQGL